MCVSRQPFHHLDLETPLKLRDFGLLISISKAFIGVISRQKSHHRLLNHPEQKAMQVCRVPCRSR